MGMIGATEILLFMLLLLGLLIGLTVWAVKRSKR